MPKRQCNLPNVLLSGPPGSGKSAEALSLLSSAGPSAVLVDYTALWSALTGKERDPDTGAYPKREADDPTVQIVERVRRWTIQAAAAAGLTVIATNASGSAAVREQLLAHLSAGEATATERVIDPGIDVARQNLAKGMDVPVSDLPQDCQRALDRWYSEA